MFKWRYITISPSWEDFNHVFCSEYIRSSNYRGHKHKENINMMGFGDQINNQIEKTNLNGNTTDKIPGRKHYVLSMFISLQNIIIGTDYLINKP